MRRLQAIAQSGLAYTENAFEVERYHAVRAVAVEMAARMTGAEPRLLHDLFASGTGHATPKVAVRAAAFRDDAVLLVRGVDDGLWTLPGGWVEVGERPSEAVEKELRQESGYEGRPVKLIAVYDVDVRARARLPFHAYTLVFLCELLPGEAGALDPLETDAVEFFREDGLPELSKRTSPERLARVFGHHRNPGWPADFD